MSVESRIYARQQEERSPLQKFVDLQSERALSKIAEILAGGIKVTWHPEHTSEVSVGMMSSAKQKIVVVATRSFHPWLFPSPPVLQALDGALKKGVDISVVFGPKQDDKDVIAFQKLGRKLKLYKSSNVLNPNFMLVDARHLLLDAIEASGHIGSKHIGVEQGIQWEEKFNDLLQTAQPVSHQAS